MGIIYIITCSETGKVYIGQTRNDLKKRWEAHQRMGRKYIDAKANNQVFGHSRLYRAMAKYGLDKFSISILEEPEDDQLNDREIALIAKYDATNKGYNLRDGGKATMHHDKTKAVISANTKTAFENPEIVDRLRKYKDKLDGLPPKCAYGEANGYLCYRIRRHATIPDQTFYLASFDNDDDKCKQALLDYIAKCSQKDYVKEERPYRLENEGLPPKCTYAKMNGNLCYQIRRHATIPDKQFYMKNFDNDLEKCKKALFDYITRFDNQTPAAAAADPQLID